MRDAHYFEAPRPITILSTTASATTALRPYLRTVDATTDFIVGSAGADTITFSFKTVNAAGVAIQAMADLSVVPSANLIDTLASTSGSLLTPTVTALIAGGVAGAAFSRYTASILTDSTTGIGTATYHFTGNATVTCVLRFGTQQVIAAIVI